MSLRKDMIRLAYSNPAARRDVLVALRTAADPKYQDYVQRKQREGEKPLPKDEWESKVLGKGKDKPQGERDEPKGFSESSDKMFDALADDPKGAEEIRKIVDMKPTKANFQKLKAEVEKATAPWAAPLKNHMDRMERGDFKHEFKHFDGGGGGKVSQVSELFSFVRQAIDYAR